MKQPCCPGMNNSRGAHIHLSTRQIWGEGLGREMKPRMVRPKGQGWASRLESNASWWLLVLCSISGRWMVRWLSLAWAQSLKSRFKLTDCHLNQPGCVCRNIGPCCGTACRALGSGCVWVET